MADELEEDEQTQLIEEINDGDNLNEKTQGEGSWVGETMIGNSISYKPTPIAELKKRHIPVISVLNVASSHPQKRRLEYDVKDVKKPKVEYVPESVNVNQVDCNLRSVECRLGADSETLFSVSSNNATNIYKATKIPSSSEQGHVKNDINTTSFLQGGEEIDDEIDFDQVSNELNLLTEILKEYESEPENKEMNICSDDLSKNANSDVSFTKGTDHAHSTNNSDVMSSFINHHKSPSNKENKYTVLEDNQISNTVNRKSIESNEKVKNTHNRTSQSINSDSKFNSSIQPKDETPKYKKSSLSNNKYENKNSSNDKKHKLRNDHHRSERDKSKKKVDNSSVKKSSKCDRENEIKDDTGHKRGSGHHSTSTSAKNNEQNAVSNKSSKKDDHITNKSSKNYVEARSNKPHSHRKESTHSNSSTKQSSSLKKEKIVSTKSSKHELEDESISSKMRRLSTVESDLTSSKYKEELKSKIKHNESSGTGDEKGASKPPKDIKSRKESTSSGKIVESKVKGKQSSSSSRESHRKNKQDYESNGGGKDHHSSKTRYSSESDDEVEIISDVESIITVPDSEDETNPEEGKAIQKEPGRKTSYSSELSPSRVLSPTFPSDDSLDDEESNGDNQPTSSTHGIASQHQDDASLVDTRVKSHMKNRISLGNAWRPPQRKAVEIMTPAKRLLMFRRQMEQEGKDDPDGQSSSSGRVRIGCVPNVKLLLEEKERLLKFSSRKEKLPLRTNQIRRPIVASKKLSIEDKDEPPKVVIKKNHPQSAGADLTTRQQYIDQLYKVARQLVKPGNLYSSAQAKCLEEEESVWLRSKHQDYSSEMKKLINDTREAISDFTLTYYKFITPKRSILFPPELKPQKKVDTTKNPNNDNGLNGNEGEMSLYSALSKHILTADQLLQEGYPRRKTDPDRKDLAYISEESIQRWQKPAPVPPRGEFVCAKCGNFFQIDERGFSLDPKGCNYHQKKSYATSREKDGLKKGYRCCGQTIDNPCVTSKYHAPNLVDYNRMEGFVETKPPEGAEPDEGWGVYAVDCEMYWSIVGFELGRVTVVNAEQRVVYDTCIIPENPVADYCTGLSGLTEESLNNAKVTFNEVQQVMLELFNSKTILIGHSLENDLKMLKLIHSTVVDTAIMFEYRGRKQALKTLAKECLNEVIQYEGDGHDSAEDAITCLKLLQYKMKKDAVQESKPKAPIPRMRYGNTRKLYNS